MVKKVLEQREINRMQDKVGKAGSCNIKVTVTASGKPKDIVPNCTPADYDKHIAAAVEKMVFEPATTDGKPVDWPNFEMPISLAGKD